MALTDIQIKRAPARDKAYKMADGRGLSLVVTPAGGKLWRFKYRHGDKKKLMAFGKYLDVPIAEARASLAEARETLACGSAPMEERKSEKDESKASEAIPSEPSLVTGWR